MAVLSSSSESSESQSESEPSDSSDSSDMDDLENWMILGQGKQVGDQSISLNVEGESYSSSSGELFKKKSSVTYYILLYVVGFNDQSLDILRCFCAPEDVWPGKWNHRVILYGSNNPELARLPAARR